MSFTQASASARSRSSDSAVYFRPSWDQTDNALRTPRSTAFLRSTSSSLGFFCYGHWRNNFLSVHALFYLLSWGIIVSLYMLIPLK